MINKLVKKETYDVIVDIDDNKILIPFKEIFCNKKNTSVLFTYNEITDNLKIENNWFNLINGYLKYYYSTETNNI